MVPYLAFNNEAARRFKALTELEDAVFVELVKALGDELDVFGSRAGVYEYAQKHFADAAAEFGLAIEAVLPLVLNDDYAETPSDEVIKGVFSALDRLKSDAVSWSTLEKKRLKNRLKFILSDSTIRLRARAWGLVLERPCLLEKVRILSDLRPIFTEKNPPNIEACSVIHTLVLSVSESGESKMVHIALDQKDLQDLKASIARAEHKEKVLNAFSSKAGVLSLQIK